MSALPITALHGCSLLRVALDFAAQKFKEQPRKLKLWRSSMDEDTDEAIMQRVARGDQAAFATLYDRFSPRLFAIARRILVDEQDASDALQDGFLYIWDKAVDYNPSKGRAFTWAVMIFRNKAIDRLRASRRRTRLNNTAAEELLDLDSSRTESADSSLERAERAEIVRRAMRSLPDEQRKCIEWAFLRGVSHLQLSELLGTPLGTVKTHVRRGLLRLRDALKEGGVL